MADGTFNSKNDNGDMQSAGRFLQPVPDQLSANARPSPALYNFVQLTGAFYDTNIQNTRRINIIVAFTAGLKDVTAATACYLIHKLKERIETRVKISGVQLTTTDQPTTSTNTRICWHTAAVAAIYLAGKCTENRQRMRVLLNAANRVLRPNDPPLEAHNDAHWYWHLRDGVGRLEIFILRAFAFDMNVIQREGPALHESLMRFLYKVKAKNEKVFQETPFARLAIAVINDMHQYPELRDKHSPEMLAIVAMHTASQLVDVIIEPHKLKKNSQNSNQHKRSSWSRSPLYSDDDDYRSSRRRSSRHSGHMRAFSPVDNRTQTYHSDPFDYAIALHKTATENRIVMLQREILVQLYADSKDDYTYEVLLPKHLLELQRQPRLKDKTDVIVIDAPTNVNEKSGMQGVQNEPMAISSGGESESECIAKPQSIQAKKDKKISNMTNGRRSSYHQRDSTSTTVSSVNTSISYDLNSLACGPQLPPSVRENETELNMFNKSLKKKKKKRKSSDVSPRKHKRKRSRSGSITVLS